MPVTPTIPFFELNNLNVLAADRDEATCAMQVGPWLAGMPEAGLQGAACALADVVHMYAASFRRSEGSIPVTVELSLDFWSSPPPVGSQLLGTARVEAADGDILLVRGTIKSGAATIATGRVRALMAATGNTTSASGRRSEPSPVELVPAFTSSHRQSPLVDAILQLPAARLCTIEPVALDDGKIELTASARRELERTEGVMHGGAVVVLGSLASACALASSSSRAPLRRLGVRAEYLRPTPVASPLRLRARVVHRTRRLASVHAEITVDERPTARIYESVALE